MSNARERYEAFKKIADEKFGGLSTDIIEYVSELEQHSHWISVINKQPDKYDDYLTYDEYGIITITHYNMQGWFSKNGNITHWMPLPAPPEVKNNGN